MRLEQVEQTHSLENAEYISLGLFQHCSAYSTNSMVANYNSNCIVVVEEKESCHLWTEDR